MGADENTGTAALFLSISGFLFVGVNADRFFFDRSPSVLRNPTASQHPHAFDDIQTDSRIEMIRKDDEDRETSNQGSQTNLLARYAMGADENTGTAAPFLSISDFLFVGVNACRFSFDRSPSVVRDPIASQDPHTFDDIQTDSQIEMIRKNDEDRGSSNQRAQKNLLTDDSMNADDFVIELPASFQFKVQSVDLAKLFVIRDKKIERKKNRLYEKMGIPNTSNIINHSKKIFVSRSVNRSNNSSNNVTRSQGNHQ